MQLLSPVTLKNGAFEVKGNNVDHGKWSVILNIKLRRTGCSFCIYCQVYCNSFKKKFPTVEALLQIESNFIFFIFRFSREVENKS